MGTTRLESIGGSYTAAGEALQSAVRLTDEYRTRQEEARLAAAWAKGAVQEAYAAGVSERQLGESLGLSRTTVRAWLGKD